MDTRPGNHFGPSQKILHQYCLTLLEKLILGMHIMMFLLFLLFVKHMFMHRRFQ